jgi:transposase InsO family protein
MSGGPSTEKKTRWDLANSSIRRCRSPYEALHSNLHPVKDCWRRKAEEGPTKDLASLAWAESSSAECPEYAFHTGRTRISNRQWVMDTGATRHMAWDKGQFTEYQQHHGEVLAAGGHVLDVVGRGSVKIWTNGASIQLHDVLHVPDLSFNLLSAGTLLETGSDLRGGYQSLKFRQRDGKTLIAKRRGRLYIVPGEENDTSSEEVACMGAEETSDYQSGALWHRRLGHASEAVMNRIKAGEEASGVIPEAMHHTDELCQPCVMTKMRQKFSKATQHQTKRPLELVHIDTMGPIDLAEPMQKAYLFTITDDFSRKLWVFLLKTKGEATGEFIRWKTGAESQVPYKLGEIRSDNALEFKKIGDLLERYAVKWSPTVPYTPQLNGVAERINQTILNKVRAMLADALLPKLFWGQAAYHAAYLHNLLPHGPKKKAPDSLWFSQPVSLTNLRVFGCIVYVHIPKEKRSKLDLKAWKGVFLGCIGSKLYVVYDPRQGRLVRATTLVFDENKFGLEEALKAPGIGATMPSSWTTTGLPADLGSTVNVQPAQPTQVAVRIAGINEARASESVLDHLPVNDPISPPDQVECPGHVPPEETTTDIPATISTSESTELDSPAEALTEDDGPPNGGASNHPLRPDPDIPTSEIVAAGPILRRSTRPPAPKRIWESANLAHDGEPQTYREAVNHPTLGDRWLEAIQEELRALELQGTWESAELPPGRKPITSRWVFAIKRADDGSIIRCKARLVGRGFSQIPGIDFDETYAPTVRYDTLRMVLSIAAGFNLEIHQMDVNNAYLAATLEEEIYMILPEGIDAAGQVCRLRKSLYGLKQAARTWNDRLTSFLASKGFRKTPRDHGLMVYGGGAEDPNGVLIPIYVDDMLIIGAKPDKVRWIKGLISKEFSTKDLGNVDTILGMKVIRDRSKRTLILGQEKYTKSVLERAKMTDCSPVSTPMDPGALAGLRDPQAVGVEKEAIAGL